MCVLGNVVGRGSSFQGHRVRPRLLRGKEHVKGSTETGISFTTFIPSLLDRGSFEENLRTSLSEVLSVQTVGQDTGKGREDQGRRRECSRSGMVRRSVRTQPVRPSRNSVSRSSSFTKMSTHKTGFRTLDVYGQFKGTGLILTESSPVSLRN